MSAAVKSCDPRVALQWMTIQLVLLLAITNGAFQFSLDPLQGVGYVVKLLFYCYNPPFLRLAVIVQLLKVVDPEINLGLPRRTDIDKPKRLQGQRHDDGDRDFLIKMPAFCRHDPTP